MKGVQRDGSGSVIVPDGMVYIKAHPSSIVKGKMFADIPPVHVEIMVCEHYRNKKRKKVPKKSFWQRVKARYGKWRFDRALRGFCGGK